MHSKLKKLALITMPCVVSLALSACGGSSHYSYSSSPAADSPAAEVLNPSAEEFEWGESTGEYDADSIVSIDESALPPLRDGCEVPQGALIVMGNAFDQYFSWIWKGADNILGEHPEWPGAEFTDKVLTSCSENIHQYVAPEGKSMEGYSVIVSNGNGAQTDDGNVFTQKNACLKISDEVDGGKQIAKFVSARECGVAVEGLPSEIPSDVYIMNAGVKVAENDTISIHEVSNKAESGYTIVTLLISGGANISEKTTGKYWFGDNEDSAKVFRNGEKIKIGAKIKVNDGETRSTELHVKYGEGDDAVVSSYKIEKTYSAKDDTCRLNKQEKTLGATYTSSATTFRIWSPNSSDVSVTVNGTSYPMNKVSIDCYTEVYEAKVDGDLVGKTYQFTIDGKDVRDPYGRMVNEGNGDANIVMDLKKSDPENGWEQSPELKNREDSIIYEVHVRDFTIDNTSGVDSDKRGRYLGMVQPGTSYGDIKTGIDHLKELGVTHVQLQPIYDYGTCSGEGEDSQSNSCYNWGYDPWNYNVPEDRYSSVFRTDKYDQKIKEVKTMINEMHKNGIRVIMDVVYNHTLNQSVFGNITKKYYTQKDMTGCGNTIDAAKNMVWMMIRDSLDYWVTEYHIDGFRLDLAGSFSMKDFSDWGEYLNRQHPDAKLVIYGEPWAADNDVSEKLIDNPVRTGRMHMQSEGAHVGAFNNRIRNCLRGGSGNNANDNGFIFDKLNKSGYDSNGTNENDEALNTNRDCVFMGMKAGVRHANATGTDVWSAQGFSDPEQSLAYITAHDNLALRDRIEAAGISGDEAKKLQVYAHSILMAGQGMTFIHGGEEFGRTKAAAGEAKHNTYNTTTGANDFKWDLKDGDWKTVSEAYAAYIKMRKNHPAFRMTTAEQIFENVTLDENSTEHVVIININGEAVNDFWENIKVVMNSSEVAYTVTGIDGMTKVADGYKVGNNVEQNSNAAPRSMSIWVKKATQKFNKMGIVGDLGGQDWIAASPIAMEFEEGNWVSAEFNVESEKNGFKIFTDAATSWDNKDDIWSICPNTEQNQLTSATACQATEAHDDGKDIKAPVGRYKVSVNEKTMKVSFIKVY